MIWRLEVRSVCRAGSCEAGAAPGLSLLSLELVILCLHIVFPLSVSVSTFPLLIRIPVMLSENSPNNFCKDAIYKLGHILKFQRLGFHVITFCKNTLQPRGAILKYCFFFFCLQPWPCRLCKIHSQKLVSTELWDQTLVTPLNLLSHLLMRINPILRSFGKMAVKGTTLF